MKKWLIWLKEYGVLTQIIVRPKDNNYEVISVYRKKFARKQLGITKIPSIIKDLNDDKVIILIKNVYKNAIEDLWKNYENLIEMTKEY